MDSIARLSDKDYFSVCPLQRRRCGCKFKSRRIGPWSPCLIRGLCKALKLREYKQAVEVEKAM
jgi:hypothetical protein